MTPCKPSYADELRWRLERDNALLAHPLDERIRFLVDMDILIAAPRYGSDPLFDKFLGVPSNEYEWRVGEAVERTDYNVAREATADKLLRSIIRDDGADALTDAITAAAMRRAA